MEELLYRYNPWWGGDFGLEGMVERPGILDIMKREMSSRQIVYVTGMRRVGKTTILKMFIRFLISQEEIKPERIFYISLDDYLLSKKSIIEIIDLFRSVHKIPFKEKIFLFLDEITRKEDYEIQMKNLYDSHNVKIYASSSSASVLKTGKAFLTGRNIIFEVLPLDFREYLKFKEIHVAKADRHLLDKYFEEYLHNGGIPEYVLHGDINYLRELVDDIIQKDITAVHGIRNPDILKEFFLLLMERAGKQVSINKIANILKISPDTAKRYLALFEEAYLIYLLPRCGKTNETILSPKKAYAPDLGIRTLFTGFRDKGSLFENYIYMKLKHRRPCYIYKNGVELDFLTEDGILAEVKYNREIPEKQSKLMETIEAEKKYVIRNFREAEEFLNDLQI